MAYARYFKRNGKTFGPYYYESYRDKNGKVKKRYVGREDPNKKQKVSVSVAPITPFMNKESYTEQKDETPVKITKKEITPTSNNLRTLILLIIILILMDGFFFWLYF